MNRTNSFPPASDFYDWVDPVASLASGHMLRAEALAETDLVPHAASGQRILYVSTGADGDKTAVSGGVFLPHGEPPAEGWPVISYAHGTTGIIPAAAPSLNPNARVLGFPILGTASDYLAAGYAVACTDYEGLGTAGPHPYLHGTMLAHCQTDVVRASRNLHPEVSTAWVAMGQSEGGLATLFTAALATLLGPELDYRGAVATAPPTEWQTLMAHTTDLARILTPLILHAVTYFDSTFRPAEWLNDEGKVLLEAWLTDYILEPGTVLDTFLPLMGKPLLSLGDGETDDAAAAGRLASTIDVSTLEIPRTRLDRPAFIAEGGKDEFCVPGTARRLADDLQAAGSDIEFHHYAGSGHLDLPDESLSDTLRFVETLFAVGPVS